MKYFLFDIGRVLVHYDFELLLNQLALDAGGEVLLTDEDDAMQSAVESGTITDAQWVEYLNAAKGVSWQVEDLVNVWARMFTIHETGHPLFKKAIASDVPVYTLSNIAQHHMDAIEQNWKGFFNGVDGLFLSYKIGTRKPDAAIYHHVIEQLGAEAEDCFFIDDRPDNIEGARAVGMHAHQYIPENYEAIAREAEQFFGW